MDYDGLKAVESYTMKWGSRKEDVVEWKILKDGESVSFNEDAFVLPNIVEYRLVVTKKELDDPTYFFLKVHFFRHVIFFYEHHSDPNWKVCWCYLLIIASATEIVSVVKNLWLPRPSPGHHTYPDFRKYIPIKISKLSALLLNFVGLMKSIGMRMCMIFHGMYFCLAWQISMTSGYAF
jgi:hypothetical protein